jgi:hypothetical protein
MSSRLADEFMKRRGCSAAEAEQLADAALKRRRVRERGHVDRASTRSQYEQEVAGVTLRGRGRPPQSYLTMVRATRHVGTEQS